MTATARDDYAFDWRSANQARFALPTVHPMLQLEKPFFAVGIHIVTYRRAAQFDGLAQYLLHSSMQLA
jgi:hypothetical protein